jgi:hypothetical protein
VRGKLVGSTQLASGRFAMIDNGLGFSLVPWRPVARHGYFTGFLNLSMERQGYGQDIADVAGQFAEYDRDCRAPRITSSRQQACSCSSRPCSCRFWSAYHPDCRPELGHLDGFESCQFQIFLPHSWLSGFQRRLVVGPAIPRKTRIARLSRTTSSSSRRPMRDPSFALDTVVILSTIKRHDARSPFLSVGSTARRNNGASVGSVVNAQIVIELVASKCSSWTITAGRGLPA